MKLFNVNVNNEIHLCIETEDGLSDLNRISPDITMESVIQGHYKDVVSKGIENPAMIIADSKSLANVISSPVKLICVGLNYKAHAENVGLDSVKTHPILFSKYYNCLVPHGAEINLPNWETTYDYEAELVIVMGKQAWNVDTENAMEYVFGFTCGNDLSCRDAQKRSTQWLIGKAMPGFGPCGPCIVTKDDFPLEKGIGIRSFVNGELRQDGNTRDMIFSCAEIVSYASKYICLEPGDLIFTGTPAGVQLEKNADAKWLKAGDAVDVEIEGIGRLTNYMK